MVTIIALLEQGIKDAKINYDKFYDTLYACFHFHPEIYVNKFPNW